MFRIPYMRTTKFYEDDHVVRRFRRYLPPTETREHGLIQFFGIKGGLRTVSVNDIVDITQATAADMKE